MLDPPLERRREKREHKAGHDELRPFTIKLVSLRQAIMASAAQRRGRRARRPRIGKAQGLSSWGFS
jgi:hypothetical protein